MVLLESRRLKEVSKEAIGVVKKCSAVGCAITILPDGRLA